MSETLLFGGYMSVELPPGYTDVSKLREVPDNQEVFVHNVTDQSIIVEILEYVQETDDVAFKTHFDDLVSSNDSADVACVISSEVVPLNETNMTESSSAYIYLTEQKIAKFKEHKKNTVHVNMALFRLPDFETDILVTFNNPINIDPDSSSHKAVPTSTDRWTLEDFKQCVTTLKIIDTSLFG